MVVKQKVKAPYGSWPSPITADLIVRGSILIDEVHTDSADIYWLEGRPKEDGRYVVVRYDKNLGRPIDVTPPFVPGEENHFNVRTHVYGYGGGAWLVDDGVVYFSNYSDGQLYRQKADGGVPKPITPPPPGDKPVRHYADGLIDHTRNRWIGLVEDWSQVQDREKQQPQHRIVSIDLATDALDVGVPLAMGHDFFSSARLSPNEVKLAWLVWDHPRMPWQGTLLYVADFNEDGSLAPEWVLVAGGPEESILQPEWSSDGSELWFVSDRSGWWNLYSYDVCSKHVRALSPMDKEFGQPQWYLGQSSYAFTIGRRAVAAYGDKGLTKLALLDPVADKTSDLTLAPLVDRALVRANIDVPFTTINSVRADDSGRVVFVGGSSRAPASVVVYDLASGEQEVLKRGTDVTDELSISRHLTRVKPITFQTTNDEEAYGLYYPPFNYHYQGQEQEKPPLIVMSHGGPTAQASSTLNLKIQYWTSRGIAVLDVNYRGSSGFGRGYRNRLKENWGIVDVEDCINGARHLAAGGEVDGERIEIDGERVVITGGSAGGFTTLAALTSSEFNNFFRAGASYYGIGDLKALAKDTHKFESHYLEWLIAPADHPEIYSERSPKNHVDRLSRPVIFFQGEKDPIVPVNQAEDMFNAIRQRGLAAGYYLFAGESHGFRSAENIHRSIEAEHAFFTFQVFRCRLSFGELSVAEPLSNSA